MFRRAAGHEEILAARRLHHDVYLQHGFIKQTQPEGVIDDEFLPQSTFVVALDAAGAVVGVCRQIGPTRGGDLPVTKHFEIEPGPRSFLAEHVDECVEIGSLAVESTRRAHHRHEISAGLYRFMWQDAMRGRATGRSRIRYWLAAIDQGVLRLFRDRFKFNFVDIGTPRPYMGSLTVPVVLDIVDEYFFMEREDPDLLAYFMDGLEDRCVPVREST